MTLEKLFETMRSADQARAIGLAFAKGSKAPTVLTAGPRYRGATQQVSPDSRWHIGSITKSFTATLVLQQVDRGVLDLDASIAAYLSNVSGMHKDWQAITLRQLLSHTSGLHANAPVWQLLRWRGVPSAEGRYKVLSHAWSSALKGTSGRHRYSNLGYMLAGYVLEERLGTTWEELIRTNIAEPLHLTSLGFGAPPGETDPHGHRSLLWWRQTMAPSSPAADNPAWMGPAGTIHLSLADLLRYGQAHLQAGTDKQAEFLSMASAIAMQTPVVPDYALGWALERGAIWHNGSNTMWYALLILDPQSDVVMAVVQNQAAGQWKLFGLLLNYVVGLRGAQ